MLKFINKSDPGMHKGMLRESEGVKGLVARGGGAEGAGRVRGFCKVKELHGSEGRVRRDGN